MTRFPPLAGGPVASSPRVSRVFSCSRALLWSAAVAAGCAGDAAIDLSVEAYDARLLSTVEVVVCSARDRSVVLDAVSLARGEPSSVTLPADGAAVAFAATTIDGLCGATCQVELEPDAAVVTTLVLHPCLACPTLEANSANVCRDPLCFMLETDLSGCE